MARCSASGGSGDWRVSEILELTDRASSPDMLECSRDTVDGELSAEA